MSDKGRPTVPQRNLLRSHRETRTGFHLQHWNELLAECTGQDLDRIAKDSDRDFFLSAEEAREYGVIDEVLKPNSSGEEEDDDEES